MQRSGSIDISTQTEFDGAAEVVDHGSTEPSSTSEGEEEDAPAEVLDETILIEMESSVLIEIDEYVKTNVAAYMKPTFYDDLVEYIFDSTYDAALLSETIHDTPANKTAFMELVAGLVHQYFYVMRIFPLRSFPPPTTLSEIHHIHKFNYNPTEIETKIESLRQQVLPNQRTEEWYRTRYNMLTASNIYKALGSDAQYNSLICEKCKDFVSTSGTEYVNTNLSTHWGEKYEPTSVQVYQRLFPDCIVDTTFGCITHPSHAFLGASPDGIVISGSRMGHMVEIKNRVSREINGIPSLAYWVQTQLQMEVCGLEFCDLFETCFKEFSSESDFYQNSELYDYRGVILYFVDKRAPGIPLYAYLDPIGVEVEVEAAKAMVESWIRATRESSRMEGKLLMEIQYWYLEEMSCVVIPRNREWFQSSLPTFQKLWATVEEERISGWSHRLPVKRTPSTSSGSTSTKMAVIKIEE
jgi:putative phage-type endonuclease